MRRNNGFMIKSAMYSRPFLKETKLFLTGHFNARVGKDRQMCDSLGRHEVGSMNGNGQPIAANLHVVEPFCIQHSVLPQRE